MNNVKKGPLVLEVSYPLSYRGYVTEEKGWKNITSQ